jgi:hypothetical protein
MEAPQPSQALAIPQHFTHLTHNIHLSSCMLFKWRWLRPFVQFCKDMCMEPLSKSCVMDHWDDANPYKSTPANYQQDRTLPSPHAHPSLWTFLLGSTSHVQDQGVQKKVLLQLWVIKANCGPTKRFLDIHCFDQAAIENQLFCLNTGSTKWLLFRGFCWPHLPFHLVAYYLPHARPFCRPNVGQTKLYLQTWGVPDRPMGLILDVQIYSTCIVTMIKILSIG